MKTQKPVPEAARGIAPTKPCRMERPGTLRFRVPPAELDTQVTPIEKIFVLAHFGIPEVDPETWRLEIGGDVSRSLSFSLGELRQFPRTSVECFIKCAGLPADATIATRNASNAVWSGVSLRHMMERVGMLPSAKYLWFAAPDHGTYQGWSADAYVKDIPLERLAAGDVLLAYDVNGAPLPPEHGFPLRVIVPGYYGTNSVKWLCRIEAAETRAPGIFTNELYNDPVAEQHGGKWERIPVWSAAPEALITWPTQGATLAAGTVAVAGWCWGDHEIVRVDISVDGGRAWRHVVPEARRGWSWQRFAASLVLESAAPMVIMARATDCRGATQPMRDARNAVHSVEVTFSTDAG